MCSALADALHSALRPLSLCDIAQLETKAQAVRAACATQRDAQMNRLDNALLALLRTIDASSPASERVEVLEQLVACLQAARITAAATAARQPQPQDQQLPGESQPQQPQQQQTQTKSPQAKPAQAKPPQQQPHQKQQHSPQTNKDTKHTSPQQQQQPGHSGADAAGSGATAATAGAAAAAGKELQARAADVSRALRMAAEAMQVPLPPESAGSAGGGGAALPLLQQLLPRVEAALGQQLGPAFLQPLCGRGELTEQQLATLAEINGALREEYGLRRAVMIERAKVTLQAFEWSPRLAEKGTAKEATAVAAAARKAMSAQPQVSLEEVWSLRPADVIALTAAPTSSQVATLDAAAAVTGYDKHDIGGGGGSKRPAAPMGAGVKGVIIGQVPDRGGRPEGKARQAYMP
ncbi:hypothetical protein Agub_g13368, partial [Astrephomene gubernaculifera]